GRHFNRQTSAQRRDARDVHALLSLGHGAAEDDILDLFGIDLRHAFERALDGHSGQIIGTRRPQSSFVSFANRRTHGTNNYDFTHSKLLAISCRLSAVSPQLNRTRFTG